MRTIGRAVNNLFAVAGLLVLLAMLGAPAASASYGELAHFGEAGTGKGQFNLGESFGGTDAIGVDQTTNDVYVVDGPTKKEYRLQKFELSGGQWKAVAEHKFKPDLTRVEGIEGVVVDPVTGRAYVLVLQERGENAKVDPEVVVAGALYAFATSNLEPASGTDEGLVAGSEVLHGLSTTPGESLLEPAGIALDPTTGDVVILGYEDRTGEDEELTVVLERVTSAGSLGARWRDETEFFTAGGEVTPEVTSPVVSSTGKVYVSGGELPSGEESYEEIDEVPADFTSKAPPVALTKFATEELVTFPGEPFPLNGAGLALSPEGTFYAYAQVLRQEGAGFHEPAVLAFEPDGNELGWFGGQSQPKESPHVACAVSFRGHPVLAAGKEGKVFVFDTDPEAPGVVEFGPGGTGCPTATATAPVASVNNEPVSGSVSVGAKVKFASTVTQANALATTWEFTNTTTKATETVAGPGGQLEHPEIVHTFSLEGTYTVKETIKTDDLASPTLVKEAAITAKALAPTAQFSATTPITVGSAASFDPKTSSGNGGAITAYTWNFGDGSAPVTTTEATVVSHPYSSPGTYTVTLTVRNAVGTGEAERHVEVLPASSAGGGESPTTGSGGSGGGSSGGGGGPSGGGGTGGTGASGGVLAYSAILAGSTLAVSPTGAFVIKVACTGQSTCAGLVTLRTLSAVAATRKAILTLASGSFSAAPGTVKSITLHLSSSARKLLAREHVIKAKATLAGHDAAGIAHTTTTIVSLHVAKAHHP